MFTKALYYSWIDVHKENWLKTARLYWDKLYKEGKRAGKACQNTSVYTTGFMSKVIHKKIHVVHKSFFLWLSLQTCHFVMIFNSKEDENYANL